MSASAKFISPMVIALGIGAVAVSSLAGCSDHHSDQSQKKAWWIGDGKCTKNLPNGMSDPDCIKTPKENYSVTPN